MSIIQSFISEFMTFYLIYFIVSLFRSAKGRLISFILITLSYIGYLVWPIMSIIAFSTDIGQLSELDRNSLGNEITMIYIVYAAQILTTTIAYFLFTYLFYGRSIQFKNRRLKAFEKAYNGKQNILSIICQIGMIILSIALIVIGIVLFANIKSVSSGKLLMVIISSSALVVVGLIILIVTLLGFRKKGVNVSKVVKIEKSNDFYFYIKTQYESYLYKSNGRTLKDSINGFDDYYVIENFGTIIQNGNKKEIYGLNVSSVDHNLLNLINLDLIKNDKLYDLIISIDKLNKEVITVDDEFNVINRKNR